MIRSLKFMGIHGKPADLAGSNCSDGQVACISRHFLCNDNSRPIPTSHSIPPNLQCSLAYSTCSGLSLAAYPFSATNIAIPNANSVGAANAASANTNSIASRARSEKSGRHPGVPG